MNCFFQNVVFLFVVNTDHVPDDIPHNIFYVFWTMTVSNVWQHKIQTQLIDVHIRYGDEFVFYSSRVNLLCVCVWNEQRKK